MIFFDFESVSIEATPETDRFPPDADSPLFWRRTMS